MKGAINAPLNWHRVASLLAKELSEKEKELICKHFGHSCMVIAVTVSYSNLTSLYLF